MMAPRQDIDVIEHERIFNITFRHSFNSTFIAVQHFTVTIGSSTMASQFIAICSVMKVMEGDIYIFVCVAFPTGDVFIHLLAHI